MSIMFIKYHVCLSNGINLILEDDYWVGNKAGIV
jgi:hypothetical protein